MTTLEEEVSKPELTLDELGEDCLFEILNRLPAKNLYAMADTCTQFLSLASIQYRRLHPEKYIRVSIVDEKIEVTPNEHDVKKFGWKFLNLIICGEGRHFRWNDGSLNCILSDCSKNLQMIRFEKAMLNGLHLNVLKMMCSRTETIVLHECGINDDIYDCLLNACHNLKQLIISDSYTIIDPEYGSKWMQQKYPLLTCVQICSMTLLPFQSRHWEQFFRQNPQIQSFACDHWYSIDRNDRPIKVIKENAPNLSRLYISLRGIGHLNGTYYDLNELCKSEHLKDLELQFTGTTGMQYLMRHSKILGTMERLSTLHLSNIILSKEFVPAITALTKLKRLNFVSTTFTTEVAEFLSKGLPNLEEVYCDVLNDITSFVIHAPNLRKIELTNTEMAELHLGWGLLFLDQERTKIHNACPIIIYIKRISEENNENPMLSSGLITIKPIPQDKRILSKVENTFLNV
ncbi:uncharacterized protein LOC116341106 [Contarinia nasturtii]|uniref:uncharacterized protein LOC116341106 n=1 Tax=Contarinia nasturtii TaxID=265458 RepID=UPI0012D3EC7B|nr:uncharacterized protein LOC116341106 [Contarinia nasturtii]